MSVWTTKHDERHHRLQVVASDWWPLIVFLLLWLFALEWFRL